MYIADLGSIQVQPTLTLLAWHILSVLKILPHPALLLLQDGNLGLESDVLLCEVVYALFELQCLGVESFLILVDLLG